MAAVRLNAPPPPGRAYDVFINHRGADTRHTLARQLYDRLLQLSGGRVRPFLDNVSLRPGDRLVARIDEGISQCKVAVAIFSEGYLDSAFCLHELASLVEARKVIVPIFYGVKPSGLVLPPAVVEPSALAPPPPRRRALQGRAPRGQIIPCHVKDPTIGQNTRNNEITHIKS
ncbi:toll/interleukin-1 receptor-like protein [Panicum miliaceum]|uniref:Toll/interleukin-1 receptor-like protein n=1 Tax=Panicum miliaceum TaxID=4540 RepID=A0A3L6QTA1_PANMI|nr:toll/interleukin-1 receptor-like protein [Panicum miliaceum]